MQRLVIAGLIVFGSLGFISLPPLTVAANVSTTEHPLITEQDQGEARVWRPLVGQSVPAGVQKLSVFIIKVDQHNGGSPDFWFGSENMPPGAEVQYHRHLHEDEVLYIGSGIAHVHVGSLEGDAHAGAIVFIPRNTWVTLKNIGKTTIQLLFAFNAPGFDRFMRCESVPVGQHAQPLTAQEDQTCTRLGDVEYR